MAARWSASSPARSPATAAPAPLTRPITLVHATLSPGATLVLPWRADFNALGYVLAGRGTVGAEARPARTGQLAAFGPGDALTFTADQVRRAARRRWTC